MRSNRQAGLLKVPPAMLREVTEWVWSQMAGWLLATYPDVPNLRRLVKPYAKHGPVTQGKVEWDVPLNLKGWPYLREVDKARDEFVERAKGRVNLEALERIFGPVPRGKYDQYLSKLEGLSPQALAEAIIARGKAGMGMDINFRGKPGYGAYTEGGNVVVIFPRYMEQDPGRWMSPSPGKVAEELADFREEIESAVEHEMGHVAQTYLDVLLGFQWTPKAGLPGGRGADPKGEEYLLQDREFYPTLRQEVREFNRLLRQKPRTEKEWRKYQRMWVTWPNRPFFHLLKEHQPQKYRKAVREFMKETPYPKSKTAGEFQAPPRMLKDISEWLTKRYAEAALTEVDRVEESRRDTLRRHPEEAAEYYNDESFAELELVRREARKHARKASKAKEFKAEFPYDFRGWKYERRIEEALSKLDPKERKRREWWFGMPMSVIYYPEHGLKNKGLWNSVGLLRLWYKPNVYDVDTYKKTLRSLLRTLRHELQHMGQHVFKSLLELEHGGGLPSRSIRDTEADPYGKTPDQQWVGPGDEYGQEHALRDSEFYTRLSDEIANFKARAGMFGSASDRDARELAARVWVGAEKSQPVGRIHVAPTEFFKRLKAKQRGKWKKAVKEFMKGVLGRARMGSSRRVARAFFAKNGALLDELCGAVPGRRVAVNLKALKPNDWLTVYHGTRLAEVFHLINGFDATKVHSRSYGGPRHKGLFVAPNFKAALNFASYGPVVLEMVVRAKNLHGTDYSGVTEREDARLDGMWRDKFPKSFRPYLSLTLTQSHEPQALLQGLVAPRQIKRVWYAPDHKSEGRWYTRKEFLELGLEAVPAKDQPYGQKRKLEDLGVDFSYPNYSYDEFLDALAVPLGSRKRPMSREQIEGTLAHYAQISMMPEREDILADLIEQVGFEPRAAQRYADRFREELASKERHVASVRVGGLDGEAKFYRGLHRRNKGIFYRGARGTGKGQGSGVGALGEGLYVTWDRYMAEAFATMSGGEVFEYELPANLKLLDAQSPVMGGIREEMGFKPWEYSDDPMFARIVTIEAKQRGFDGVIGDQVAEGICVFDPRKAKLVK